MKKAQPFLALRPRQLNNWKLLEEANLEQKPCKAKYIYVEKTNTAKNTDFREQTQQNFNYHIDVLV